MSNVSQWSTSAASNNSAPPDGFPEGQAPSTVNDASREVMAALAKWYSDTDGSLISGGTGTAYTLTTNSTHAALADISLLLFRVHTANTGAATLAVDGLTAKAMRSSGNALVSGDLPADKIIAVAYNATDDAFDVIGTINHDSLSGYVADQHVAHSGVTITAGAGLTGGGTIAASRTIDVGAGTGITVAADSISTNDSAIVHDNLSGFVADEHVAHSGVTLTAGTGLSGGGTIAANRTFNLDISSLTAMTVAAAGTDEFLYNDGGTMKSMSYNEMAMPSTTDADARSFASTDVGLILYYTGTGGHTWTMGAGVGQDNCGILIINSGSGTLTIAGSGVTITSTNSLVTVSVGGTAALIRESSTVWFLTGDLE